MRRTTAVLSALTICVGAATVVAGSANAGNDNDPYTLSNGHAGPMGGVVAARGQAGNSHGHGPGGGGGGTPLLTWHGGGVQTSGTTVQPIFWGNSWGSNATRIDDINGFYDHVGGSAYIRTNTEYTNDGQPGGVPVSASVSRPNGSLVDGSNAPNKAPQTSTILNEVIKATGGNVTAGGYYPVYIDQPRGHAGYCAWHSWGTVSGTQIEFGFFFKLDNDPGCSVHNSAGHNAGTAALINVSGHELSETVTDPVLNAWYDSSGAENADKCAWTFSNNLVSIGSTSWQIQGNFSNAASAVKAGYDGGGCIDGNQ